MTNLAAYFTVFKITLKNSEVLYLLNKYKLRVQYGHMVNCDNIFKSAIFYFIPTHSPTPASSINSKY